MFGRFGQDFCVFFQRGEKKNLVGGWINLLFTCFLCNFQGFQKYFNTLMQHTKGRFTKELSGLDPESYLHSSSSLLRVSGSKPVTN